MNIEKEIIGACLVHEKCFTQAVDELEKKHFEYFAPVFECIQEFHKKGRDHQDINYDVKRMMKERDDTSDFFEFVNHSVPSINEHVEELKEDWRKRETRKISDILYEASKQDVEIEDYIMQALHDLSDVIEGDNNRQQTMAEVMADSMKLIDKLRSGEKLGFTTGLDIDSILQGFQKGQFYILAARPSMGKTALAIQIAQQISTQTAVGFLSLETTNQSLGLRHLTNHASIGGEKIRGGYIDDEEFAKLNESAGALSGLPIITDDTTDLSAEGIRAKVNAMKRKHDIEFLIIDYVQLMKSNKDFREQQIAEISRACVGIAKEFDICVLGLAQLNRKATERGDKRPMLSDLRESGQLEQDAFCVMLLHRPEYYGIMTDKSGESTKGVAEIIIAKHKDGRTGIKKLHFNKPTMEFKNLQYGSQSETSPF